MMVAVRDSLLLLPRRLILTRLAHRQRRRHLIPLIRKQVNI